jgi:hypothetical protein
MSRCIVPSTLTIATTSSLPTTFSPGSLFGLSPYEDGTHHLVIWFLATSIYLTRIVAKYDEESFESAVRNDEPSSVVFARYAKWQESLATVHSHEDRRHRHQAALDLERDKEQCARLWQAHLRDHVVATPKASFRLHRLTRRATRELSVSAPTGIDSALHRVWAACVAHAACLDAVLAEINKIVHHDLSPRRPESPAHPPRLSASDDATVPITNAAVILSLPRPP